MEAGRETQTTASKGTSARFASVTAADIEQRSAALHYLADTVLCERDAEPVGGVEGLRTDILSAYVSSLDPGQWMSLREKMSRPMTQAQCTQLSRRMVRLVSELVFQLLVPALMGGIQDTDSPKASSSKLQADGEEENQDQCNSATAQIVTPYVEDPPESYVEVKEGESSQDMEQYLEPAVEEIILAIIQTLHYCQEETNEDVKTEGAAIKIVKHLAIKMICLNNDIVQTKTKSQDMFYLDSLDDDFQCCWILGMSLLSCKNKRRVSSKRNQEVETPQDASSELRRILQATSVFFPVTVSSQEAIRELSCTKFRHTSLKKLNYILMLMSSSQSFGTKTTIPETYMDSAASEIVDTVINSITQLCQTQPEESGVPEQSSESTTLSEVQVATGALLLKVNLKEKLRDFFSLHKETSDRPKDTEEEQAIVTFSEAVEFMPDVQEDFVLQSTNSSSSESNNRMIVIVESLLDETELSMKEDGGSVQGREEALIKLEDLISHDQLQAFCKHLVDNVYFILHKQELEDTGPKVSSDSALYQWTRYQTSIMTPTEEVYQYVEEAVKYLLASITFPPPSWGNHHTIQVTGQVMGSPSNTAAASEVQEEEGVDEMLKKEQGFFKELSNRIKEKYNFYFAS